MIKLSHAAKEAIDLARSGSLGRDFPTWEDIVKKAQGDPEKIAQSLSRNYGRNVSETDVRTYIRIYNIDIQTN